MKDRQHNGQKKRNIRRNNDLQNTTHKTKDRVTRTPLSTGCEIRCSGRVSSSCSSSDTSRVTLVTNLVISYERGQDPKMFTESETYPSFVTYMFRNGWPSHATQVGYIAPRLKSSPMNMTFYVDVYLLLWLPRLLPYLVVYIVFTPSCLYEGGCFICVISICQRIVV